MGQENAQKVKLLKLMELLRQETDEDHPLRRKEICDRLEGMGIRCDIRTLSKDIKVLNDYGFEVLSYFRDREKYYYVPEAHGFSETELKILIDAVQAAGFITGKKTAELICKVAALGGSHKAKMLQDNMVCFNTRKHSNEMIYYNVNHLETAIRQHQRVSFRYFDLNEKCEHIPRKDGRRYQVDPLALVFNEDNYYLMTWHCAHRSIVNYRVDRMEYVEIEDEPISDEALSIIAKNNLGKYTEQVFKMYNGAQAAVKLQFDASLIGAVFDKFGEDTRMRRTGEQTCEATVNVRISPVFYSWIFQFGGKMKIISPNHIIEEYHALLRQESDGM